MNKNEITQSNNPSTIDDLYFPALEDVDESFTTADILDELDGEMPSYPKITLPSAGSIAFEIPGDIEGSSDILKNIEGIIVMHHTANAYWDASVMGNSPPVCFSIDGKTGTGPLQAGHSESCSSCLLNQFGSGEGGSGKACKNMKRLYILTTNNSFPYVLNLPPTSIKSFTTYVSSVISKKKRLCDVVTNISLVKKINSAGQSYSCAVFKTVTDLSPSVAEKSQHLRQTIKMFVNQETPIHGDFTNFDIVNTPNGDKVNTSTGEVIA